MATSVVIREALESSMEELHQEVEGIVERYWTTVLRMEGERKDVKQQNKLRIRSIKEGNSVRAEWYVVTWVGKGKNGKPYDKKQLITKPARSFGYTLSKLLKYAHEWEKPIVEETEAALVGIRQEAHHLTRALLSVGFAEQAERKRRATA